MANTATLPATSRPAAAPARAARTRRAFPSSGTALLLIFSVALILGVLPIAAVIASPTWLVLGIALGTNLLLTLGILLTLLRYLED